MPNTENIKMPKYLMIQNIKIPGCGRGPVALADGSNSMAMGRGLGHGLELGDMTQFLSLAAWDPSHGHGLGLKAIALGPWPRAWLKANGHKLGAMAQDIRYPGVRVGEACGPGVAP